MRAGRAAFCDLRPQQPLRLLLAWRSAQSFPSRTITGIVAFCAGGLFDVLARVMGERMRQSLGQLVVIENVSGGAGEWSGVGRFVRAAPDGGTFAALAIPWNASSPTVRFFHFENDVSKDFEPVVMLPSVPSAGCRQASIAGKISRGIDGLAKESRRVCRNAERRESLRRHGEFLCKILPALRFNSVHYWGGWSGAAGFVGPGMLTS